MSTTPPLFGDVPLPVLLDRYPNHGFEPWVIDDVLQGKTFRSLCSEAGNIRLIFCRALHALSPDGPTSEKECVWRTDNAVCLHGEQWTSGLGIIRQLVQAALGAGLASPGDLQTIVEAQDALGVCDMSAHSNATDVREGRIPLKTVESVVAKNQAERGRKVLPVRNTVLARVQTELERQYDAM